MFQGSSKDMICGKNSILILMNNGDVFVVDEMFDF
jgi:hypothetical protein